MLNLLRLELFNELWQSGSVFPLSELSSSVRKIGTLIQTFSRAFYNQVNDGAAHNKTVFTARL